MEVSAPTCSSSRTAAAARSRIGLPIPETTPDGRRHSHGAASGSQNCKRIAITLALVPAYMAAEMVGGLLTNSLALLAYAGHTFSDAVALGLALWCARRLDEARSGSHRPRRAERRDSRVGRCGSGVRPARLDRDERRGIDVRACESFRTAETTACFCASFASLSTNASGIDHITIHLEPEDFDEANVAF